MVVKRNNALYIIHIIYRSTEQLLFPWCFLVTLSNLWCPVYQLAVLWEDLEDLKLVEESFYNIYKSYNTGTGTS